MGLGDGEEHQSRVVGVVWLMMIVVVFLLNCWVLWKIGCDFWKSTMQRRGCSLGTPCWGMMEDEPR